MTALLFGTIPGGHHKIKDQLCTGKIAPSLDLARCLLDGSTDRPCTSCRASQKSCPNFVLSVGQELKNWLAANRVQCRAQVETVDKTGVEMEALTAVQWAC